MPGFLIEHTMSRAAIYGAGSLGTILGAFITKNGGQIDLINHNQAHVKALNENGAKVVGTMEFTQKVTAITDSQMSGMYDIIFLMTKQQHNREVVTFLKDYLASDGVIVTLQNGLPEIGIAEIVGEDRVLGCTVAWGATMKGAASDHVSAHLNEVKELLEMMGPVELEHNFIGTRWSKLLINAGFSGMSAVTGSTFGEAAADRKSRKVLQKIIKECIDVCKAANIRIEPIQGKDVVKLLDYSNPLKKAFSFCIIPVAIRKHALLKASMLQDLEHGKKTEVDSINGSVCEFGRRVGVPTPANDKVVEIIHRIEAGDLKPSFDNVRLFLNNFE